MVMNNPKAVAVNIQAVSPELKTDASSAIAIDGGNKTSVIMRVANEKDFL